VKLGTDPHGIDQFLADIGDPIAAWSGEKRLIPGILGIRKFCDQLRRILLTQEI